MIENQAKVSFVRNITCFVTLPLGLLLKSLKLVASTRNAYYEPLNPKPLCQT